MKKNILKFFVLFAIVGVGSSLYWYYDFQGGAGAGTQNDVVDIGDGLVQNQTSDAPLADAPSDIGAPSAGWDDGTDSDAGVVAVAGLQTANTGNDARSDNSEQAQNLTADGVIASPAPQQPQSQSPQSSQPTPTCSLSGIGGSPSHKVILNEIAWMGSLPAAGETSAKAGEREWIELKNISPSAVDLSGWQILNAVGNLKIDLSAASSTEILPGGFFLLVRDDASLTVGGATIPADAGYFGGLSNAGDDFALMDSRCGVSDILDASTGWPGGNNTTKQTLERDADAVGWHTSAMPGGTPRAENSVPAAVAPPLSPATQSQHVVSISLPGAGTGMVSSTPAGILCGFTCESSYPSGTKLALVAVANSDSFFNGWSGVCNSTVTTCSFIVSSSISVAADFEKIPTQTAATVAAPSSSGVQQDVSLSTPAGAAVASSHLLIAQIQIAGGASSNDFVKIFNPTAMPIDISGWKLHKKSSTGTDYSLKTFAASSTIAANGYFVWANSESGFADSIGADASSTETLSADNSIALFDASGDIVDQVAWGTGTNQYVEGVAYPTDPTANQMLTRSIKNGVMTDSDNNSADFAIQ